jgi:hypothetical protein
MTVARWIRLRAKILWLAFRVWQHTRAVRTFRAKLEAHMAKFPERMHDEEGKFYLAQLKQMQMQDAMFQAAAKTLTVGLI